MKFIVRFRLRYKKQSKTTDFYYIYVRLRVDGIAAPDFTTGVKCTYQEWDSKAQKIKGYSEVVRQKNIKLAQINAELENIYNELRKTDKPITAQIIKKLYTKKTPFFASTLLTYYDLYINEELRGQLKTPTVTAWVSRRNTLAEYIKTQNRKDLDLEEVTPKWVKDYYNYHINTLKNKRNHSARAVQCIKKVLDYAVIEGALPYNPTLSLKVKRDKKKPIKYLTIQDLEILSGCPYYPERLQRVVDAFLIQCYTGMAYGELRNFTKNHLHQEEGVTYIKVYRNKSEELCLIPILSQTRALLEKYDYCPQIITNQKMNDFIKEAAQMAGLKNWEIITTHVGRSTAGTFLLNKGVEIKVVSKILGHKSVLVTEMHYAELLTDTITKSMIQNNLL